MFKISKINLNLIKIFLINQSEVILVSAVNYLISIYAARSLSISQFGMFAVLYSFFLLIQGIYINSLGETMLIKKDIKSKSKKQTLNHIINLTILIVISLTIISVILFTKFKATLFEVFIYSFSVSNLVFFTNTRFFNLSKGENIKSLKNVITFSIITFLIFKLKVIFRLPMNSEYHYFILLGLPAFFINLINLKNIRFVIDKKFDFSNEYYLFIYKSFFLALIIWSYGHLHWILIGSLVSLNLVGILKGCFSLVSPLFSINRAMSIFFLNISSKKNDLKTLNQILIFTFILSNIGIILWLIFPSEILNLTIGIKYYEYKNIITILFLIPPFGNSMVIANSFLKFNNKFRLVLKTYIFSAFLMNIFVLLNKFIEIKPFQIALLFLLSYIFNFIVNYLGIRRINFLKKAKI